MFLKHNVGVSGKIAAIMERLRSDYRCNVSGRPCGYRGAERHDEHGVDASTGPPGMIQEAERLGSPLINRSTLPVNVNWVNWAIGGSIGFNWGRATLTD